MPYAKSGNEKSKGTAVSVPNHRAMMAYRGHEN
jgi:hypothetical protein